jgi:hypothetical protein
MSPCALVACVACNSNVHTDRYEYQHYRIVLVTLNRCCISSSQALASKQSRHRVVFSPNFQGFPLLNSIIYPAQAASPDQLLLLKNVLYISKLIYLSITTATQLSCLKHNRSLWKLTGHQSCLPASNSADLAPTCTARARVRHDASDSLHHGMHVFVRFWTNRPRVPGRSTQVPPQTQGHV